MHRDKHVPVLFVHVLELGEQTHVGRLAEKITGRSAIGCLRILVACGGTVDCGRWSSRRRRVGRLVVEADGGGGQNLVSAIRQRPGIARQTRGSGHRRQAPGVGATA